MLLTEHKLSVEEIAAEYCDRMPLLEKHSRSKAKDLVATMSPFVNMTE